MFSLIRSPYGKLFFVIQEMAKDQLITSNHKDSLKDLLIQEHETILPLINSLLEEMNSSVTR